jgi:hypothetical protein
LNYFATQELDDDRLNAGWLSSVCYNDRGNQGIGTAVERDRERVCA